MAAKMARWERSSIVAAPQIWQAILKPATRRKPSLCWKTKGESRASSTTLLLAHPQTKQSKSGPKVPKGGRSWLMHWQNGSVKARGQRRWWAILAFMLSSPLLVLNMSPPLKVRSPSTSGACMRWRRSSSRRAWLRSSSVLPQRPKTTSTTKNDLNDQKWPQRP